MTKSTLVEKIAEVIIGKKLPMLVDVRDESTDDVRIVLEIEEGRRPELVMAYLYKHTPLADAASTSTSPAWCPTENTEIAAPAARSTSRRCCSYFLDFR